MDTSYFSNENISRLVEGFAASPWLVVLAFLFALTSVPLTVFFFFKSRKLKLPIHMCKTFEVISSSLGQLENLELSYAGNPLLELRVTKVAFWNDGRETLHGKDIAEADPLTIYFNNPYSVETDQGIIECIILDADISFSKNPANKFSAAVSNDRQSASINFDYIDKGEGAVVRVFHTGMAKLRLKGSLKGAKYIGICPQRGMSRRAELIFLTAVGVLSIPMLALAILGVDTRLFLTMPLALGLIYFPTVWKAYRKWKYRLFMEATEAAVEDDDPDALDGEGHFEPTESFNRVHW